MRNLMQYPVTDEEIIECLRDYGCRCDPEDEVLLGDMRPTLIEAAIQRILDHPKRPEEISVNPS